MLKINNLAELIDMANVELEHDIPDGTIFEYKNNYYIIKQALDCNTMCSKGCDIRNDFDNDIEKSDIKLHHCSDDCPFGIKSVAVKLSEIETLILKNKE